MLYAKHNNSDSLDISRLRSSVFFSPSLSLSVILFILIIFVVVVAFCFVKMWKYTHFTIVIQLQFVRRWLRENGACASQCVLSKKPEAFRYSLWMEVRHGA